MVIESWKRRVKGIPEGTGRREKNTELIADAFSLFADDRLLSSSRGATIVITGAREKGRRGGDDDGKKSYTENRERPVEPEGR